MSIYGGDDDWDWLFGWGMGKGGAKRPSGMTNMGSMYGNMSAEQIKTLHKMTGAMQNAAWVSRKVTMITPMETPFKSVINQPPKVYPPTNWTRVCDHCGKKTVERNCESCGAAPDK